MSISAEFFGTTREGSEVTLYQITNSHQDYVELLDYGAAIRSIVVKDSSGQPVDVCLGYDTIEAYEEGTCYFGACVGRFANRLENAAFTLNGTLYTLASNCNDGHHLHGGLKGFDRCMFQAALIDEHTIAFSRTSPDMEEGYPGNLEVTITYHFSDDGALTIDYRAVSDRDTIVNLTNHTYFNLSGADSRDATDHQLQINADAYTQMSPGSVLHGEIIPVAGTIFDFRTPKTIAREMSVPEPQFEITGGYDHNFVLNGSGYRQAAIVKSPKTGITLEVDTDMPCIQFYNGNFVEDVHSKTKAPYVPHCGFALETQLFPNAINCPAFPSPVLKAGETYHSKTTYSFSRS